MDQRQPAASAYACFLEDNILSGRIPFSDVVFGRSPIGTQRARHGYFATDVAAELSASDFSPCIILRSLAALRTPQVVDMFGYDDRLIIMDEQRIAWICGFGVDDSVESDFTVTNKDFPLSHGSNLLLLISPSIHPNVDSGSADRSSAD